jgi:hypothetical protein
MGKEQGKLIRTETEDIDMPELTNETMLLITTSFQALERLDFNDKDTFLCNSLVTVVFLGFYVEASLDFAIQKIGNIEEIKIFLGNQNPGLFGKLAWFYYFYFAVGVKGHENEQYQEYKKKDENGNPIKKGDKITRTIVNKKLEDEFPGFNKIVDFRNDISHGGNVSRAVERIMDFKTREEVDFLRTQAKCITDKLEGIIKVTYPDSGKNVFYSDVIGNSTSDESSS